MSNDECPCGKCQTTDIQPTTLGFRRDLAHAKRVISNIARGQERPYWIVHSHQDIYYFMPVTMEVWEIEETLRYLGCSIVATFDWNGDEVKGDG